MWSAGPLLRNPYTKPVIMFIIIQILSTVIVSAVFIGFIVITALGTVIVVMVFVNSPLHASCKTKTNTAHAFQEGRGTYYR